MDSTVNNVGSEKMEKDAGNSVDTSDSESNATLAIGGHFGVKADDYLRQMVSIEQEFSQFHHESVAISNDLETEKDLKQAMSKYYSELIEFDTKTKANDLMLQKKNDLMDQLNESISKIIGGCKSQLEVCKEIGPLTESISGTLSAIEEAEATDARDCAFTFAELANKGIKMYGYADKCAEVQKIDTSKQRNTDHIAADCLRVFKFLMEKGPYDPYEEEIISTRKNLREFSERFDELKLKKKLQDQEMEEVDRKLAILMEEKNIREQKKAEAMKKTKEEGEAANEKVVSMIQSNTEKQAQFVSMGKKIEFMKEKLKDLPELERELEILNEELVDKSVKLAAMKNTAVEIRQEIISKKENIESMKKRSEIMAKEHEGKGQELRNKVNNMEIELRESQIRAQISNEEREQAKGEYERIQERLKKIEDEFRASKEAVRQKKTEKKKNLREKRKLKDQLERELTMLSLSKGINPY